MEVFFKDSQARVHSTHTESYKGCSKLSVFFVCVTGDTFLVRTAWMKAECRPKVNGLE